MSVRLLVACCVLTGFACSTSGVTNPTTAVAPIQIDGVDVLLMESFPVQVTAHVEGVVGDGCSTVLPLEMSRSGNLVTISILRERPVDAVCTQIARLYDERIPLGTFASGEYVLRVNDVERSFRVD
jgi:inhibitor of cysteine peptidase